jgi:ubiquitin-protein ligase
METRAKRANKSQREGYHRDEMEKKGSDIYRPVCLLRTPDFATLPGPIDEPSTKSAAHRVLIQEADKIRVLQDTRDFASLGWFVDFENLSSLFAWFVELHTFPEDTPLAKDMRDKGCSSIVMELRFDSSHPFSPPVARVIRPRLRGGHVASDGAIRGDLFDIKGWSPAFGIEEVFERVRLLLCDKDKPTRLALSEAPCVSNTTYQLRHWDEYKIAERKPRIPGYQ